MVSLFFIQPLNISLTLLVEPCQPTLISAFLSKARLEENSQILWLVFEQSLYMPLEYLHTGCYEDCALPLYIDSNDYGVMKPGWNHFQDSYFESDGLEIVKLVWED